MKTGTPGFVGLRLKEAREARAISLSSLGEVLGVTRQAVSRYESSERSPSPDVMRRICERLNLPMQFFLMPAREERHQAIFYRSMASTTQVARTKAERRYAWLRDIVAFLRGYLKFSQLRFPNFELPSDPLKITDAQIREFALETRRFWGLGNGPISNIAWLLENCGAIVSRFDLDSEKLDAFSEWNPEDNTPYVILNSAKNSAARSRFDIAHELGHLILHRTVDNKSLKKKEIFSVVENQAHLFAGEFLLPKNSFAQDLNSFSLESFKGMKAKWKLSIGFLIKRAGNIGLISPEHETQLWKNRSARGWTKREPLDDVIEPELPRLLRQSFDVLFEHKVIVLHDIPFRLGLEPKDVEDLAGLPAGYLDKSSSEVGLVRLKEPRDNSEVDPVPSRSDVMRFPGLQKRKTS